MAIARPEAGICAGRSGLEIGAIKQHDPESKGIVERRNGFFETSKAPTERSVILGGVDSPLLASSRRLFGPGWCSDFGVIP